MFLVLKVLTSRIADWEQRIEWPILSKYRHNCFYIVNYILEFWTFGLSNLWKLVSIIMWIAKSTYLRQFVFEFTEFKQKLIKVFPILTCNILMIQLWMLLFYRSHSSNGRNWNKHCRNWRERHQTQINSCRYTRFCWRSGQYWLVRTLWLINNVEKENHLKATSTVLLAQKWILKDLQID